MFLVGFLCQILSKFAIMRALQIFAETCKPKLALVNLGKWPSSSVGRAAD